LLSFYFSKIFFIHTPRIIFPLSEQTSYVNLKRSIPSFQVHNTYYNKEAIKMACGDNCKANECIKCSVQQCAFHCNSKDYCSLDCIQVGTHESNPTMDQCTDCQSFKLKA
jgi:hypothetical protein